MVLPAISALLLALSGASVNGHAQGTILLETDSFVLGMDTNGRVTTFLDRQSGNDYCNRAAGAPFAEIHSARRTYPVTSVEYDGELLKATFDGIDGQVAFRVIPAHRRMVFEIASFSCKEADELVFAQIPLSLRGVPTESFGASPLALNLKTNCQDIPGLSSGLTGFIACKRFGFEGAQGAVVAAPMNEQRDALKDAVKSSPDLVQSPLGGPWALDAKQNQASYLITANEAVTKNNVDGWVDAARAVGAGQIDFHGEKAFRWGDFEVNPVVYPNGRASLKAVVDTVHEAGLAAGLHTFAFFIAKDTPWVTPVPDPRLDSDATFTLAGDIAEEDTAVPVAESTETMSTVTGFVVYNSVTLRIDDELVTYAAVGKQAPYAFTQCTRGAYGTHAAPHARGASVYHLKECFGLFVPQGDSDLFTEVAQKTADLYNACGFDMLYLDALDGVGILAGGENGWHYSAKFACEVARRLDRPAVMEMSTFSHHLWTLRSRMEAWDCPARGVKDYADLHVLRNLRWKSAFLPTHLGWWATFEWKGVQPERSFLDDLEYVCAKALATDSSLSYVVGFTPDELARGNAQRLAAIAKRYENLRSADTVPDSIKAQLAVPGTNFTLDADGDGHWQFRPANYSKHRIEGANGPEPLVIDNPYGAQPLKLRIEALLDTKPCDSPDSTVLADLGNSGEFGVAQTRQGVTATLERAPEDSDKEHLGAVLVARNTEVESNRAWASFKKDFPTPIDLKEKGLGLWVQGDGQGEVLNVQVRSPQHLGGGLADHYIRVDFTGWRPIALVEPESEDLARYEWAHTRRRDDWARNPSEISAIAFPMYHVWVDYGQIASLTLGLNNLPAGKSVRVGIGTIKAVPLCKKKLVNPTVTLGDNTLTFPVELDSGSCLEFLGQDNCRVYDARGECIGVVVPTGRMPVLEHGKHSCTFGQAGEPVRARITVITYGEPLSPEAKGGDGK